MKPFYANDYTSFLIWSKKYKKNIVVYITSPGVSKKFENFMVKFEKIPKNKETLYRKQLRIRHEKLNKTFRKSIFIMRNPIKKMDQLLSKNYSVAVLTSDYYSHPNRLPVPHWIVSYKKRGNNYYFADSASGFIVLTKQQILKGFRLNKKTGLNPQLIGYRCSKC